MAKFEFVSMGTHQPEPVLGKIFIDVGNALKVGIVDHHQIDEPTCAARLVVSKTELVTDWIPVGTKDYTIVVHLNPDLDCVSSAFIARALIETGKVPACADLIADFTCNVDQGKIERPNTNDPSIYEIYEILRSKFEGPESSTQALEAGLQLLTFVEEQVRQQKAPETLNGLFVGDHPYAAAVEELVKDKSKYEADLMDTRRVYPISLHLPRKRTGIPELVDGLVYHDPTASHFKLWARTDEVNSPQGQGFIFTHVITKNQLGENKDRRRVVISVDPNSNVDLRNLGDVLNRAERALLDEHGIEKDDNPRPGYEEFSLADPWYDGRAHDYTIVDTPRNGSQLSLETIEHCLYSFKDINSFQSMSAPDLRLRLMFQTPLKSVKPVGALSILQSTGWSSSVDQSGQLSSGFHRLMFENKGENEPVMLANKKLNQADGVTGRYRIPNLGLAIYEGEVAVLYVDIESSTANAESIFQLNAALGHAKNPKDALGELYQQIAPELEVVKELGIDLTLASMKFRSCYIKFVDAHTSRDQSFFDRLIATLIGEKREPIAIQKSDMDVVRSGARLGQFGRLVIVPQGSYLIANVVDSEVPASELRSIEKLYKDAGEHIVLNACLQHGVVESLMSEVSRSTAERFGSFKLSKRFQRLQERLMAFTSHSVNHNPSTNTFVNNLWERLNQQVRLPEMRSSLNQTVNDLAEYVDTRRKASIDRVLFVLSLLVGPLTLLTDYIGAILHDKYSDTASMLPIVGGTYAIAVTLVVLIVLGFRVGRR